MRSKKSRIRLAVSTGCNLPGQVTSFFLCSGKGRGMHGQWKSQAEAECGVRSTREADHERFLCVSYLLDCDLV